MSFLIVLLSVHSSLSLQVTQTGQQPVSLIPSSDLWRWVRGTTENLPSSDTEPWGRISRMSCPAPLASPEGSRRVVVSPSPDANLVPKAPVSWVSLWSQENLTQNLDSSTDLP